ncbi:MAG: DUF2798 domain-containing protein [Comamonas sp.]
MSPALQQRLLVSSIMSITLSTLMTAWVIWLNVGFTADFLSRWQHAFLMSWPAAFTIVMLIGPSVQRLAQWLLARSGSLPATGHKAA